MLSLTAARISVCAGSCGICRPDGNSSNSGPDIAPLTTPVMGLPLNLAHGHVFFYVFCQLRTCRDVDSPTSEAAKSRARPSRRHGDQKKITCDDLIEADPAQALTPEASQSGHCAADHRRTSSDQHRVPGDSGAGAPTLMANAAFIPSYEQGHRIGGCRRPIPSSEARRGQQRRFYFRWRSRGCQSSPAGTWRPNPGGEGRSPGGRCRAVAAASIEFCPAHR